MAPLRRGVPVRAISVRRPAWASIAAASGERVPPSGTERSASAKASMAATTVSMPSSQAAVVGRPCLELLKRLLGLSDPDGELVTMGGVSFGLGLELGDRLLECLLLRRPLGGFLFELRLLSYELQADRVEVANLALDEPALWQQAHSVVHDAPADLPGVDQPAGRVGPRWAARALRAVAPQGSPAQVVAAGAR
jgi:hypothetical protein